MSSARKILEDALTLPNATRADVAAALLASLGPEESLEPGEGGDWVQEIERRADHVRTGRSTGTPWHSVRERLLSRLHTE